MGSGKWEEGKRRATCEGTMVALYIMKVNTHEMGNKEREGCEEEDTHGMRVQERSDDEWETKGNNEE